MQRREDATFEAVRSAVLERETLDEVDLSRLLAATVRPKPAGRRTGARAATVGTRS